MSVTISSIQYNHLICKCKSAKNLYVFKRVSLDFTARLCYDISVNQAGVAKSADARDLKSLDGNIVPVQVRSPAPKLKRSESDSDRVRFGSFISVCQNKTMRCPFSRSFGCLLYFERGCAKMKKETALERRKEKGYEQENWIYRLLSRRMACE